MLIYIDLMLIYLLLDRCRHGNWAALMSQVNFGQLRMFRELACGILQNSCGGWHLKPYFVILLL